MFRALAIIPGLICILSTAHAQVFPIPDSTAVVRAQFFEGVTDDLFDWSGGITIVSASPTIRSSFAVPQMFGFNGGIENEPTHTIFNSVGVGSPVTVVFELKNPVILESLKLGLGQDGPSTYRGTHSFLLEGIDPISNEAMTLSSGAFANNWETEYGMGAIEVSDSLAVPFYGQMFRFTAIEKNGGVRVTELDGFGELPQATTIFSGTVRQSQDAALVFQESRNFVKKGAGQLVVDKANAFDGWLHVIEGDVALTDSGTLGQGGVSIYANASLSVASTVEASLEKLSIRPGGTLNLANSRLTVNRGISQEWIKSELQKGRGDGSWNGGSGITSSTVAADIAKGLARSVGWKTNPDDSITVAYAAPGDTNLDGEVNVFDLVNVNSSGTYGNGNASNWSQGDFDYNGVTNIWDMILLNGAGVYRQGSYLPAAPPSVNAVPEPSTCVMALAGLACGGFSIWRRRLRARSCHLLPLVATIAIAGAIEATPTSAQFVNYELVPVGDPGNAPDTTGYGAVPYEYQIGKYEVTIGQYTAFLNAVAKSDPAGLYPWFRLTASSGISREGSEGFFSYRETGPLGFTPPGADSTGNRPITYISWLDAARFANWMSNGQPAGPQGALTTENGAYDFTSVPPGEAPIVNTTNPNTGEAPIYRLPSEGEWYKAAYYKGGGSNAGYWKYATQSDAPPGNTIGWRANQANVWVDGHSVSPPGGPSSLPQNHLTNVGAFAGSPSGYGTFDQSGNVMEWIDSSTEYDRAGLAVMRGGSWNHRAADVSSANREVNRPPDFDDNFGLGVRLSSSLPFGSSQVSSMLISVMGGVHTQVGAGLDSIVGQVPIIKTGNGTLVLDKANMFSSFLSVTQGEVSAASPFALGVARLNIAAGANLSIASQVGALNAVRIEKLGTIAGTLDVGVGRFTLGSSSVAVESAKSLLVSGRNGGGWDGSAGITSTAVAADLQNGIVRSVGWKANSDGSVTVAYAAPGDTNLDGEVNVFDLVNVNSSGTYGRGNPSNWSQGDFDYNGVTNIFDMVQTNGAGVYGRGSYLPAAPPSVNAVPEPATYPMALAGLVCGGYVIRRRWKRA